jgi:ribosomal protein L11 methyltransferase
MILLIIKIVYTFFMVIKALSFRINPSADLEAIWQSLEDAGCTLLYSDVSENGSQILGNLPFHLTKEQLLVLPEILGIDEIELPAIDWEAQWAAQEKFRDGFLHVELEKGVLKLIPGAGFGDHSHPTTRLVLRLMVPFVSDKDVIDIGCGSGILSLAAHLMGARSVCGVDIDETALAHSRANAACNSMTIPFLFPEGLTQANDGTVILMNMIQSEQEVAWKSVEGISDKISIAITSGILAEGREDYLKLCAKWEWRLLEELEEDGWLGFVLQLRT